MQVIPEPKKIFPDRDPRPLFDGGPISYALKLAGIELERCRLGRKDGLHVLYIEDARLECEAQLQEEIDLNDELRRLAISCEVVWL